MQQIYVWDPLVRIFHWSLVLAFTANAVLISDESPAHLWIGYSILGLVMIRVIWGFIGTLYARFASFLPSLSAAADQMGDMVHDRKAVHPGQSPLGALMIYNILGSFLMISLSGIALTMPELGNTNKVEDLHEFFVIWTGLSVLLHIAAIIFESHRTNVNLPRAMVTSTKNIPVE